MSGTNGVNKDPLSLGVHPRVIFQLGESLITDPVQALIELVKNSYDADASFVGVEVDTTAKNPIDPTLVGSIRVHDNGTGMDADALEHGWLNVSISSKAEMKREGKTSPRHKRHPLGDKGVGRLGTQRLGSEVRIVTHADPNPEAPKPTRELVPGISLTLDWRKYLQVDRLDDVKFDLVAEDEKRPGTELTISGLDRGIEWDTDGRRRLGLELSKMISPFDPPKKFSVAITVDNNPVDLADVDSIVRRAAQTGWSIAFDGKRMTIDGRVSQLWLRPDRKDVEQWKRLVVEDDADALRKLLATGKSAKGLGLTDPLVAGDAARFVNEFSVDDLDRSAAPGDGGANPGEFNASIESFSLASAAVGEQVAEYVEGFSESSDSTEAPPIFNKAADYRKTMKDLAGVRVYRDGFGVRVGQDWLGLGAAFTSASSFSALRPGNTVGFVNISAGANQALVETTDREGFVENAAYRTFLALLNEAVSYINSCLGVVGKGWDELRKQESRESANVPPEEPTRSVAAAVAGTLGEAEAIKPRLDRASESLAASGATERDRQDATDAIRDAQELLDRLPTVKARADVVESELAALESSRAEFVEMISLGLTAEALSHELSHAVNRLQGAVKSVRRKLSMKKPASSTDIASFVAEVESAISALRKQLAHLDPSLRYARAVRQEVHLTSFLSTIAGYHTSRWDPSQLEIVLTEKADFEVNVNPGRLTQVFDNLILNSEYWATQQVAKRPGRIVIEILDPFVTITDNGPGIHPAVEESLFEPFVTRKPRGKGRGLGLFVVRELLDLEEVKVRLSPVRNKSGRHHTIELDFTGARVG